MTAKRSTVLKSTFSKATTRPKRITMGWTKRQLICAAAAVISVLLFLEYSRRQRNYYDVYFSGERTKGDDSIAKSHSRNGRIVPKELLGLVYNETDFINTKGITPTYWGCKGGQCSSSSNKWGPCFAPHTQVNWNESVDTYREKPVRYARSGEGRSKENDLADLCRPGFLVIGAGKCGTR